MSLREDESILHEKKNNIGAQLFVWSVKQHYTVRKGKTKDSKMKLGKIGHYG